MKTWLCTILGCAIASSPSVTFDNVIGMEIVGLHKEINVIRLDNPAQSICIVKIKEECVLEYDGASEQFIARRTINIRTGQQNR